MKHDYADVHKCYIEARKKVQEYYATVRAQCLALQMQMAKHRNKMEARCRELGSQSERNEEAHTQKVDSLLASIPSESIVNEWTQTYLDKSEKLKEITLTGKTATSSITASLESCAANGPRQ